MPFIYKFVLIVCGMVAAFGFFYGMQFDFASLLRKIGPKKSKKSITLKDKIDVINNEVKGNFFKKQFVETSKTLEESGRGDQYKKVRIASVVLAIIGGAIGFVMKNLILAPVLIVLFAAIPFIYVKNMSSKHRRRLANDLESGLSIITTSYLRNENIVEAVRENVGSLPVSIRGSFEEFLFENEYITPNLNTALNNLKFKINHPVFHEWVNALIQCSDNKDVKQILEPIIAKFAALRTVQSDLDTAIASAKFEAVLMALITLSTIPLVRLLNKDWFDILVKTTQGKVSVVIALGIVAFCLFGIVRLSRPVEFYEIEKD